MTQSITAEQYQKLSKKEALKKRQDRYKAKYPDWQNRIKKNSVCIICGKSFYAPPTHLKKGQGIFCSRKCKGVVITQKANRVGCKGCGKLMQVKPCAVASGRGRRYCSVSCRTKSGSYLEAMFEDVLIKANIGNFEREHRFHPIRKWRFDFAWVDIKLAVEIQGGIWLGSIGGHTSAAGRTRDCEKHNAATVLGWRVMQFTKDMIVDGTALQTIQMIVEGYHPNKNWTGGKSRG